MPTRYNAPDRLTTRTFMAKHHLVAVRVDDHERDRVWRAAKAQGFDTMSDFLRARLGLDDLAEEEPEAMAA